MTHPVKCPDCGHDPIVDSIALDDRYPDKDLSWCVSCFEQLGCEHRGPLRGYSTEKEAIIRWNKLNHVK